MGLYSVSRSGTTRGLNQDTILRLDGQAALAEPTCASDGAESPAFCDEARTDVIEPVRS